MQKKTLIFLWLAVWLTQMAAAEIDESQLNLSIHVALDPTSADLGAQGSLLDSDIYRDWFIQKDKSLLRLITRKSPLWDKTSRYDFLRTVYYESLRAGVNPDWVLAIIQVESAFRKYAISSASARGFMQVMPFWPKVIGVKEHNLFYLRTNIRYGTVILRHYIDIENGSLFRAFGRYNGSLGSPVYPNLVRNAYIKNWQRS